MYYLGIDIGGTNTKIGLISEDYKIINLYRFPTADNILNVLITEINNFFKKNYIAGIGIGVAGLVSTDGIIIQCPNIFSLNKVSLYSILSEKFAVPIKIANDATVATYAEAYFGEGVGINRFILLTLGTGIGGGLYDNHKVMDFPMEIGHISINYQGKLCSCGNNGCLEMYASVKGIKDALIEEIENGQDSQVKQLYGGNFYKVSSEDIYRLALDGDNLSRQVLKNAGKALGTGMANLINIFAPDKIILTGGLSKAKNIYIETAINEAKKRALNGLSKNVVIVQSRLIDSGGVLGAVCLLRSQ